MFVAANAITIDHNQWVDPPPFTSNGGSGVSDLAQRVNEYVGESFTLQLLIGSVIGVGLGAFTYTVLTTPLLNWMWGETYTAELLAKNPFGTLGLEEKLLLFFPACIVAPVVEEFMFRESVHEFIKVGAEHYLSGWFSDSTARKVALVAAIVFGSVLFGLIHFGNVIEMGGSLVMFVPQVINATFLGVGFAIAKELTPESWFDGSPYDFNGLKLPIFMHFGNNLTACIINLVT